MHLLGDMLQCLDKSEFEYIYFEASFEDTSFFDLLKTNYLSQGFQPLVVVAKMYPPINYLLYRKDNVDTSWMLITTTTLREYHSRTKSKIPVQYIP